MNTTFTAHSITTDASFCFRTNTALVGSTEIYRDEPFLTEGGEERGSGPVSAAITSRARQHKFTVLQVQY